MNGLEKPFRKKPIQKIENSKNQSEIAACEQKPLARKRRIFVQTPFSHSNLNLKRKNFTPQYHSRFRSLSFSA